MTLPSMENDHDQASAFPDRRAPLSFDMFRQEFDEQAVDTVDIPDFGRPPLDAFLNAQLATAKLRKLDTTNSLIAATENSQRLIVRVTNLQNQVTNKLEELWNSLLTNKITLTKILNI